VSELDPFPSASPYAPPESDVDRTRTTSGRPLTASPLDPSKVDPAVSLQFPFQHANWWQPPLLVGLVYLVPIYGVVLMFGWLQHIYDGVREGTLDRLPPVDWGGHFSRGWRLMGSLLVGTLLWTLVLMVGMGGVSIIGAGLFAAGQEEAAGEVIGAGMLLVQVPLMFMMLASYAIAGELGRRALNGDLMSLMRWRRSIQVIIAHPVPYIITLAGLFAAAMAMYVGVFACYFGMLFSMPLGGAMAMHVLAQWDRYLEHQEEPAR
jgi:hypothetical protein